MSAVPIEMRTFGAFEEFIIRRVHKRRDARADNFPVDLEETSVATRTSRGKVLDRIERIAGDDLAELLAEVVGIEIEHVRRRFQALVASQHDAILGARSLQHRRAADVWV